MQRAITLNQNLSLRWSFIVIVPPCDFQLTSLQGRTAESYSIEGERAEEKMERENSRHSDLVVTVRPMRTSWSDAPRGSRAGVLYLNINTVDSVNYLDQPIGYMFCKIRFYFVSGSGPWTNIKSIESKRQHNFSPLAKTSTHHELTL